MLCSKILSLAVVFNLTFSALAEEKTFGQNAVEAIPTAIADAVTQDAVFTAVLFPLLGMPAYAVMSRVAINTVGAAVAQTVRYACKNTYTDGKPSVLCGARAGFVKYGLRSLLSDSDYQHVFVDGARGAVDLANYEMNPLGPVLAAGENVKAIAMVIRNEVFNEFVKMAFYFAAGLHYADANLAGVRAAFIAPLVLSSTIFTTSSYFHQPVKEFVEGLIAESEDEKVEL